MEERIKAVLNTKRTIFTASGIYTGLVVEIHDLNGKGYGYVLENVIFRPTGNIKMQMPIPEIVLYSDHFIATTFSIEPISFD